MKNSFKFLTIVLIAISTNTYAQRGPSFTKNNSQPFEPITPALIDSVEPITLDKEIVQNVYVSPSYVTYLEFPKKSIINRVDLGSEMMVNIKVDSENNAVLIFPTVMNGNTNMVIVLDEEPYVFEIYIQSQGEIDQRITYTTKIQEMESLRFGPALAPNSIDLNKWIRLVETYGNVKSPYKEHGKMQYHPIGIKYNWDGDSVYLTDAFGYPNENIVVLRLARRNLSNRAKTLFVNQIEPYVANTKIPVTLSTQSSPTLYPGQMEKMYLVIQGYNLFANQNWRLKLPPSSKDLEKILR